MCHWKNNKYVDYETDETIDRQRGRNYAYIWEHGPMFVRELLSFYDEPKPHYNTVSTLVRGLEEKGFVGYKAYGNTYQYYALVSEKEYKSSALKEVVSQYYNNSYINVVSSFIEEEGMSVDELKSLIEYIEQSKKKK